MPGSWWLARDLMTDLESSVFQKVLRELGSIRVTLGEQDEEPGPRPGRSREGQPGVDPLGQQPVGISAALSRAVRRN